MLFLTPGFFHLPFLVNYLMFLFLKLQTFTYCSAKLLSQVDRSLLLLKDSMLITSFVLEMTLESPLDCKEIQPVHSKGDKPWVFFGRNDAKAETPVLWPPHVKS